MNAMNCPRCGKVFSKVLHSICAKCHKLEEDQYLRVREYIEEEPLATLTKVAEATEVPTKTILRFIREGRIIVSDGMKDEVRCSQCGKAIDRGNFCNTCSEKIKKDFLGSFKPGGNRSGADGRSTYNRSFNSGK